MEKRVINIVCKEGKAVFVDNPFCIMKQKYVIIQKNEKTLKIKDFLGKGMTLWGYLQKADEVYN